MNKIFEGLARCWSAFMEYNKAFDGTLLIVLIFITLWKMLGMLEQDDLPQTALEVLLDYTSVFSHLLSAIVGALFMKSVMNGNNGGKPNA